MTSRPSSVRSSLVNFVKLALLTVRQFSPVPPQPTENLILSPMTTGRFLISTTDWSLVGAVFTQPDSSVSSCARSTHAPTNFSPLAQVICPPIVTMSPSLGVVFVGREVGSDEGGDWVTVSVTRTVCVGCGVSGVCEGRSVAVTVTVAGAGFASRPGEPQPADSEFWGFTIHGYSFLVVDYLISRRILLRRRNMPRDQLQQFYQPCLPYICCPVH